MKIEEKIAQIEEEIRTTPLHKGTEHHLGLLRAKLAKLRRELNEKQTRGSGLGFAVKKSGDATVVLVGPPSVGKSTLINKLTRASSKVGHYDFTTLGVIPGMMRYQGAQIQLFDIPGIIKGAAQGKGRGREVLSVTRAADLILMMVDVKTIDLIDQIKKELSFFGVRLDEKRPLVTVKKKSHGGLKITLTTPLSRLSPAEIEKTAREFGFQNAEIVIKEDLSYPRLVDALLGNCVYLPYLIVVNKIDLVELKKLPQISSMKPIFISLKENIGLRQLRESIWQKLALIRVYLKPKGKEPDFNEPLVVKKGTTIKEILAGLSLCTKEEIKRVKIFGPGAKFPGQEVSFSFQPQDETIISFLT